jgi:hypothetical protein
MKECSILGGAAPIGKRQANVEESGHIVSPRRIGRGLSRELRTAKICGCEGFSMLEEGCPLIFQSEIPQHKLTTP